MNKKDLLEATHQGLLIYKLVLSYYYKESFQMGLSGKRCLPFFNPFNEKKETLIISRIGNVFHYHDIELPEFKGDPFDFAALHYKLQGDELLEKINQGLHLQLMMEEGFKVQQVLANINHFVYVLDMPSFSYYHCPITNTKPNEQITLLDVFNRVKDDSDNGYKARTLELRGISDPEAASQYKRTHFDFVTASGIFSKRSNSGLVCHSGLLTLDFDHVENLPLVKEALLADANLDLVIDMMFDSPSGTGFKSLVSINIMQHQHHKWFEALAKYLKRRYDLEVDKSGKDVARACFLPYDPNVYIYPLYLN